MLESGQVYILIGTLAVIIILQKFTAFRQEERAVGCVRDSFSYGLRIQTLSFRLAD